jgi:hypothetical protein
VSSEPTFVAVAFDAVGASEEALSAALAVTAITPESASLQVAS